MKRYGLDRRWPFAEGGGATITFFVALLLGAALIAITYPSWATASFVCFTFLLLLFILWFFRDPNRQIAAAAHEIVSPGDGRIVTIAREFEPRYLQSEAIRISMFLSVTNVHVQRVPYGGKVTLIDHRDGKFLPAFQPEASEQNEQIAMVVATEHGPYVVKQIAGIVARRCVNLLAHKQIIKTGQRLGLIRFGSRVDLYLPLNAEPLVKIDDMVTGGITAIARFPIGGQNE